MKTVAQLCALILAFTSHMHAQEIVRPIACPAFGKPTTVKAEFVAKSDDYYSQNMVREGYALRVLEVGGVALSQPVVIEYKLESGKETTGINEKLGVPCAFEAYESVYQPDVASPWRSGGEQGMQFTLIHVLHIRPKSPKG